MAKHKSHKSQHWIPQTYLQKWQYPFPPPNFDPFVHVISKDGNVHKRKSPKNIFAENDFYTIKTPDGHRNLVLENGLKGLEQGFAAVRDRFILPRHNLPANPYLKLIAFVGALHCRTKKMRDHHRQQWQDLFEKGEHIREAAKKATPRQRAAMAGVKPTASRNSSISMGQVRQFIDSPMEHILPAALPTEVAGMLQMQTAILCTDESNGFITSDSPVVWFDPSGYQKHPMFRAPGLATRELEITCPLSPGTCLLLTHQEKVSGLTYIDVPQHVVSEINRRTRFATDTEFVSLLGFVETWWFDPGEEPSDSWEKRYRN